MIDRRPAAIARCRSADDVVAALARARAERLEVTVRGGGHNVAGTAVADGALMIDLSPLRYVNVDPAARRARVGGGATWGDVDRATQAHGLAVTGGMISTTGVGGLTLGGGLGWLMGRHGLTVDNLAGAEVVLADGALVHACTNKQEELFWALRGGGGNFGVVTEFELELHPVGPEVMCLRTGAPLAQGADVLRAYRELTSDAPDLLTANASLIHDETGAPIAAILGCSLDASLELPPRFETAPMPYAQLNSLLDAAYPRGAHNYWKSAFLRELSDDAIDALVAAHAECPSPMGAIVLEHLHGAATRVPVDATAVPHREEGYNFLVTAVWTDPADTDANVAWARATYAAMEPFVQDRRYVNYLAAEEADESLVRSAFGRNYERLRQLKQRYDPENVFRHNQNIPPAR
jgi:FAD/FMN-containing dehydrogenase